MHIALNANPVNNVCEMLTIKGINERMNKRMNAYWLIIVLSPSPHSKMPGLVYLTFETFEFYLCFC